jgi:hypothetical protein
MATPTSQMAKTVADLKARRDAGEVLGTLRDRLIEQHDRRVAAESR